MEIKNLIPEQESAVVDNDTCASSLPTSTITRTIGKTTYIANLHFKKQGQTFSQKLKRVLKADAGNWENVPSAAEMCLRVSTVRIVRKSVV